MANVNIQLGHKDLAWFNSNPTLVLLDGQMVYLDETGAYKLGDGVTELSSLSYLGNYGTTVLDEFTNSLEDDDLVKVVIHKDNSQNPTGSSYKLKLINLYNFFATKINYSLNYVLAYSNNTGGTNILVNNADAIELENGSLLKKGTYDFGGGGGISQICSVGYEDNWQSGIRHVFDNSGNIRESSNCFNIIPDNTFDGTLRFKVGSRWVLDNGDVYVCSDASTGTAVWDLYSNQVNADWNATSGVAEILNKPSIPAAQIQSDWNQTNNASLDYIKNKPTVGTGDMLKSTYDTDNTGIVDNAEAIKIIGRNSTGVTLYRGTVVYLNGATGNRPNFAKAKADAESTSAGTFGVIVDDIANNADGYCIALGYLDNLDTRTTATYPFTSDTLAAGDTIYLSPTTAGYITNVKPYAPNHLVYLGKVTRTSPTNGTIVYRIQNGYELDELHNVQAQSPTLNDTLYFDNTVSPAQWKTASISTILGYTPEAVSNKVTTFATLNNNLYPTTLAVSNLVATKQDTLVSGTNIKTVNSSSLLGSGNISVGTVTSVAALTLGTTGTDVSSTVATGTTTPVITFNLPTASATNRGALSSTDWSTFNGKQNALGFTPVTNARTITINGVTYDLTADRTWTISTTANTSINLFNYYNFI